MEQFNPFSLTGKQILVTGASSGIGRGIALACAKMGATVIVTGRNVERLNETLAMLQDSTNSLQFTTEHKVIAADLTKPEDIERLVNELPKLDGFVQCAGVGSRVACKDINREAIDYTMNANFEAPVLLQSAILKKKKVNKAASIVYIASIAAWSPSMGNGIYSASKGAIISYAQCLAQELAPRLIRVNCICPAMVWTDLVLQDGVTREDLEEDEKRYPLKRYGTPEDIANLAIYLLSDASGWMTGSNIKISGG